MSLVLIVSIVIKVFGAALEIVNQAMITNCVGMDAYGDYSFYITIAEIVYWVLFSSIVKCNTFYLSDKTKGISSYKKHYYFHFTLPVLLLAVGVSLVLRQYALSLAVVILIPYILMYDRSSTLMARGHYTEALIGEYTIGRLVNCIGIVILMLTDSMSLMGLLLCYFIGYIAILLYFFAMQKLRRKKDILESEQIAISGKKAVMFQVSDMTTAAVDKAPIVLQYLFVDAYTAGFVSIIVLVKRLVSFVTGPTAKVFMPEFARLYKAGDKQGLRRFYGLVMRIQMLFISCLCIPMLVFPKTLLGIFDDTILQYETLFRIVALIFLLMTTLGPCTSLLQMTGQEQKDNIIKITSIVVMLFVWFILRNNPLFTLYGLCAQLLVEIIPKVILICVYFRNLPQPIHKYIGMWVPVALVWLIAFFTHIPDTFLWMVAAEVVMLLLTAGTMLLDKDIRVAVLSRLHRKQKTADQDRP